MTIRELVCNGEFSFNVDYRIIEYRIYDDDDGNILEETEEIVVMWDSKKLAGEPPYELLEEDITSINQNDDGSLDIEYVRCEL